MPAKQKNYFNWVSASDAITVFWPYPDGTDQNTPFTLLRRATVAADTADYALNLSGLAFDNYQAIEIYFTLTATENADITMYFNNLEGSVYLNSMNVTTDSLGTFSTAKNTSCRGYIRLLANQWGVGMEYFFYGKNLSASMGSCNQINASTLTALRLKTEEGVIQSGSTFWIIGVKKMV